MEKRKRLLTGAVLLLFLAFWLYLAWCVPYTQDDWDWGLDIGMEQWLTASLNNRYVGTFFVILMTRSAPAKVLVLGGGMFAIPLLLALLAVPGDDGARRPFLPLYLAANLLMVLLPQRVWRQTCGWVSGFANYGVSVVFFLGWLLLLRRIFTHPREKELPLAAALFFCSFALGLFVETQSAVNLLTALCVLACALRAKRGRLPAAAALAGAALGLIVIFFNPLYGDLAASGQALDGIRKLSFPAGSSLLDMASAVLYRLFGFLFPLFFELGLSFPLLLSLITLLALWDSKRRSLCLLALWPAVYGVLMVFFRAHLNNTVITAGCVAALAIPLLAAALAGGSLPRRLTRLGLLLAGLAMVAPMALVMDVGGRLFFLDYVLTALVALEMAAPLLDRRLAVILCALAAALQMFLWVRDYTDVLRCSALRRELIQAAVARGDSEVLIPTEEQVIISWERNPSAPWRAVYYKDFYGIPRSLHIVYLAPGSYQRWPDYTQADLENAVSYPQ